MNIRCFKVTNTFTTVRYTTRMPYYRSERSHRYAQDDEVELLSAQRWAEERAAAAEHQQARQREAAAKKLHGELEAKATWYSKQYEEAEKLLRAYDKLERDAHNKFFKYNTDPSRRNLNTRNDKLKHWLRVDAPIATELEQRARRSGFGGAVHEKADNLRNIRQKVSEKVALLPDVLNYNQTTSGDIRY